jgi:hypothetical protein
MIVQWKVTAPWDANYLKVKFGLVHEEIDVIEIQTAGRLSTIFATPLPIDKDKEL